MSQSLLFDDGHYATVNSALVNRDRMALAQPTGWKPPENFFPSLRGTVALDTENHDPGLKKLGPGWCYPNGGKICGFAIASEELADYWPIAHASGNLDPEKVVKWIQEQAKNPDITWLMHNAPYDLGWSRKYGIRFAGKVFDTGVAAPLLDENRHNYSLDALGADYCGERKDETLLKLAAKVLRCKPDQVKSKMAELSSYYIAPYAIQDAKLTRKLWFTLKPLLDKENLWPIFDLETRLINVLLDMRERGVRVDLHKAEQQAHIFGQQLTEINKEMRRLSGVEVQVWAADSIAKAFDRAGVSYDKPASGAPSFRAGWLEAQEHILPKLIVKARRLEKAKGTFLEGHILGHARNGRIHAVFSALRRSDEQGEHEGGAVTGRFSSSCPNLQNLPSRDEEMAALIRGIFLPEEGHQWGSIDFSSQEPRLAVHFANIAGVRGVQPFVDAYRANPRLDFHSKGAEITKLKRKDAKNLTLGKMYRMGGAKMCRSLGFPTKWIESKQGKQIEVAGPEGQAIMDQYDTYMPFVKLLNDLAERKATQRHWIRTILGRARHFLCDEHPHGAYPYKALNCLIQGSAADMMKKAMVDLYELLGVVPLVTVHDELGLSVEKREIALEYQRIMVNAVPLSIPMAADLEMGETWGASMAA